MRPAGYTEADWAVEQVYRACLHTLWTARGMVIPCHAQAMVRHAARWAGGVGAPMEPRRSWRQAYQAARMVGRPMDWDRHEPLADCGCGGDPGCCG